MKRIISIVLFVSMAFCLFSQDNKATIKFLKGNISEKTAAVTSASGEEAALLSSKAIEFALDNKEILGNDRDLDALVVAAILSISPDYVKNDTPNRKQYLESQLIQLFKKFNESPIVQISVLSKLSFIDEYIPTDNFTALLNDYLKSINIYTADSDVINTALKVLETIGNSETFLILYSFLGNENYEKYNDGIKATIAMLVPISMNEILSLIHNKSESSQIKVLFDLIKNNSKISKNNLCEIAENLLIESILIAEDSLKISEDDIALQLDSLRILSDNKWTRASSICVSYLKLAKNLYNNSLIDEKQFKDVIVATSNIAPIDSVIPLTEYLAELNGLKEEGVNVSEEVLLAVINSLGAIGDKSAFDSLLAVTYLNYSESVLTAARKALSGLRWQ